MSHDSALLVSSVERHIEVFGVAPIMAATDRGFPLVVKQRIQELGVRRAAIPHSGHRSKKRIAHERQRWFRPGKHGEPVVRPVSRVSNTARNGS